MYIRLPVNCSSASETEATSTRRKSAIKALSVCAAVVPATACARRTLAPHKTALKRPMDTRDAAIVWDFTKSRNLFISSSWMYICARTLTPFFVGWKSQSIYHKEERQMKMTIETRAVRWFLWAFAIALTAGLVAQRSYGQERKAINLSPARGLPFSDGVVAGNTLYVAGQEGTDDA